MKTLFTVMAFVPLFTCAQIGSSPFYMDPAFLMDNYFYFDQNFYAGKRPSIYKDAKVKEYKVIRSKKNGTKEVTSENRFNTDGRLVYQKNSLSVTERVYENDLLTDVSQTYKKTKTEKHSDFDSEGRVMKVTITENGKLKKEVSYTYFEGNKCAQTLEIRYGRKTSVSKYITEYDELLKTPTASYFYINGKLKSRFTYTCDTKGQLEEKKIVDITSCHYDAKNSDGSYIEYTRTINDGKVYLTESYFTKDSVLTEQKSFFNETKLTYHFVVDGNTSTSENFTDNGKRIQKTVQTKDENGNLISVRRYGNNDRKTYGYDAQYNEFNLTTLIKNVNGKSTTEFEYIYY